MTEIFLNCKDVTSIPCDVIVNSANPWLGGIGPSLPPGVGGVDGAIHRAAGINLLNACQRIRRFGGPVYFPDRDTLSLERIRCNYGDLKITKGYKLPCKLVFHVVSPRYRGGEYGELTILEGLYDKIFHTLIALGYKHIVIPSIGTRSYGVPIEASANIAVRRALHYSGRHQIKVEFSLPSMDDFEIYKNMVEKAYC